jgi:hypothetical protein
VEGNNGENRSLDGMLTHDSKKPRSIWWAYKCYGDMTGKLYDVSVVEEKPGYRVDGLTAYNAETKETRILIGSYENERTLDIRLALTGFKSSGSFFRKDRIRIKALRIPDTGTNPFESPLPILDESNVKPGKDLILHLPHIAPGEVVSVQLGLDSRIE